MRMHTMLEEVQAAPPGGRAVAIGVFDGVHRGHQSIIAETVSAAARSGGQATVVTFDPHPDTVLRPGSRLRSLTMPDRRVELLWQMGIQEVVTVGFDQHFAQLQPEAFCTLVLSATLGAKMVLVGENFRFGRQGSGTVEHLVAFGASHNFGVRSIPLVKQGGEAVSSTRIRVLLDAGDVAGAAGLLGRPHRLEGVIIGGARRGRSLQAPTANLELPEQLALPGSGIYVTKSSLDGSVFHDSVTSVGTNPTFHDDEVVRVETLLLDYQGDLYGSPMVVDFLQRLREQKKFRDAASLAEQIRRDVLAARQVHERLGQR